MNLISIHLMLQRLFNDVLEAKLSRFTKLESTSLAFVHCLLDFDYFSTLFLHLFQTFCTTSRAAYEVRFYRIFLLEGEEELPVLS